MFVRQIEYDTSVDRFLRVNEERGVLQRRSVGLDHDLQKPRSKNWFSQLKTSVHGTFIEATSKPPPLP